MKPHLPLSLLRAVLACFTALTATAFTTTAAELTIPGDYTSVEIDAAEDFASYYTNSKYAFLLTGATPLTLNPSNCSWWSTSDSLFTGTNYIFTSQNAANLISLTFGGGTTGAPSAFRNAGNLEFQGLGDVAFSALHFETGTPYDYNRGGAIYADADIEFLNNNKVTFSGNSVVAQPSMGDYSGGAVYAYAGVVHINDNGGVSFVNNFIRTEPETAYPTGTEADSFVGETAEGGAILAKELQLSRNDRVEFSSNYIKTFVQSGGIYLHGGAIRADDLTISNNNVVVFNGNGIEAPYSKWTPLGGAIYSYRTVIRDNREVSFTQNYAGRGSAISSDLTVTGNERVVFEANRACNGAETIYSSIYDGYAINSGNCVFEENGEIVFNQNVGGALYATNVSICGNEKVTFSGNYVQTENLDARWGGAAIYCGRTLFLRGSARFEKNYQIDSGKYRLRGVSFFNDNASSSEVLEFSAPTDGLIAFYDGVYATAASSIILNRDYDLSDGSPQAAKGDILFSGRTMADDLADIKGSAPTEEELSASLNSSLNGAVHLHGGRLRVEDGVTLTVGSFTTETGSSATLLLKNASMSGADTETTVSLTSGSTLSLEGTNSVTAKSLTLEGGSAISFILGSANEATAVLSLGSGTTLNTGALTLNLSGAGLESGRQYKLITTDSTYTWDVSSVSGLGARTSDLTWVNGTLYFQYSGATIPALTTATWSNGSSSWTWDMSSENWTQDGYNYVYQDGVDVVFGDNNAGNVTLVGTLLPKSVLVNSTPDYIWSGSGKLSGGMTLTKQGTGKLTIETENDYTGGTTISGGTLVVAHGSALGTGGVQLNGGTLRVEADTLLGITSSGSARMEVAGGKTLTLNRLTAGSGELTISNEGGISFADSALSSDTQSTQGGVATLSATVTFDGAGSGVVSFTGNSVSSTASSASGGAIGGQSALTFSQNTTIAFEGNYAKSVGSTARGGAIDTKASLLFSKNEGITFSKNYAASANDTTGGAIRAGSVTFNANTGDILFRENKLTGAAAYGGAIIADSDISFTGNKNITFNANSASGAVGSGGAIAIGSAFPPGSVDFSSNNNITFTGNNVSASGSGDYDFAAEGGAISAFYLTFSGNKAIEFSSNYATSSSNGNSVSAKGGAIYAEDALSFIENEAVTFSGNYASSTGSGNDNVVRGGALYVPSSSELIFSGNGMVTFSENYAYSTASSARGGAIDVHGTASQVTFSDNGDITFSGNHANSNCATRGDLVVTYGGAIVTSNAPVTFSGNRNITFNGNYGYSEILGTTVGGAIWAYTDAPVIFDGNKDIEFSRNYVRTAQGSAEAGAIASLSVPVTFSGNGNIVFSGNNAYSERGDNTFGVRGGAISASSKSLTFSHNNMVTFRDNYVRIDDGGVSAEGGAIWITGDCSFVLRGSALFERNHEVLNGTYRLRSVYQTSHPSASMELSALTGESISFRDGVYAGSDVTVTLNKDYVVDSVTQKADGDILFTGATMAADLKTIKGGVDATPDELSNSLTSELLGTVTLHGGRLRVEDGVKLTVGSFSTATGSNATLLLKDASVTGASSTSALTLTSGSKLDLRGVNTITANSVTLEGGTTMAFTLDSRNTGASVLTLGAGTSLSTDTLTLNLSGSNLAFGEYKLLTLTEAYDASQWTSDKITVIGLGASFGNLTWNDGTLSFVYTGGLTWDSSKDGQDVVFNGGENVTIIGDVKPGSVVVDGDGTTTWNGPGSITGDTSVIKNGSGTLVVNNENTYTGGTILNDGTISVKHDNALGIGMITMNGGTLEMNGHDLSKNDVVVKSGCTLDAGNGGKVKELTLDQPQKFSSLGNEYFDDATSLLTLKGSLIVNETLEVKHGVIGGPNASITAEAVAISGGTIDTKLLGNGGVTKTGSGEAKILGNQSYTGLTHVKGGTLSVYGSLGSKVQVDAGARLRLEGAFNGADMLLAQGARLVTKSGLSISGSQNLSCRGTIVGDLTLAGGTVTATPGDFLSITGTLTLANNTRLVLSGSGWGAGSYDLFQFKNLSGSTDYATFFGLTNGSIAKVGDKLVLTLTQAPSSTLSLRTLGSSAENADGGTDEAATLAADTDGADDGDEGGTVIDGNDLMMTLREALRRSDVGHVAIQSTWSAAAAQREFSDLLRQRRLQGGTGTAWVSMLGGHSRMSGTGGSDVNRMGGALGVELTVSESGNIGLAAGSTWSRLNPENHGRLHQNAQSVGLYGNAKLFGNATDSVWLSWDAAYGRTRTHGPVWNGSESWTQQSAVLATRATWARMIGQNTAVQGFGGLEYLALDSAKVQGERTGSVQNLRGEIGAGITHNAGRASVYAEAALVGDMLRHNPVTTFDGVREQGLNPGRVGLKVSVGGSYRLNDTWSANAAYTLEAAEHNTQHSANIGVSYTF